MKFTIENLHHKIEDFLGDDNVTFHFDIHISEPEEFLIKNYPFHYHELTHYLQEANPALHAYLSKIRKDIGGWGPKENKIFEALEPDTLNEVYKYVEECLLKRDWQLVYEREQKWKKMALEAKVEEHKKIEKVFDDLSEGMPNASMMQRKFYRFAETVEKQIQATAVDIYPELMNGNAEQMDEFRYLFSREVSSMHERLSKHLESIRKANT